MNKFKNVVSHTKDAALLACFAYTLAISVKGLCGLGKECVIALDEKIDPPKEEI